MSALIRKHAGLFQLALVVAIVGGAVLLSASLKPDAGFTPPRAQVSAVSVSVIQPATEAFEPLVELNGVVEARTLTSIIPQVSGKVVSVSDRFRPGASVGAGEVLFVIDPSDYELAVERTLAEIEVARSDLLSDSPIERFRTSRPAYPRLPLPKPAFRAAKRPRPLRS